MREDAASQRRIAAAQEKLAGTTQQFGEEDRARANEIFSFLRPFATQLINAYNPEDYASVERPARPDFSPQYIAEHKRELANIEDDYNRQFGDAADYASAAGISRFGTPGMAMGVLAGNKAGLRTQSRQNLTDRLTGEKEAGWMDRLQAYYDAINKRQQDVGIATQGANVATGQQTFFNPNASFGVASSNYGGSTGSYGNAAQTQEAASRLPSGWAKVGGAIMGGLNAASRFMPTGWIPGGSFGGAPAPARA